MSQTTRRSMGTLSFILLCRRRICHTQSYTLLQLMHKSCKRVVFAAVLLRRYLRNILRSARAARGRRTNVSIAYPRSLWCCSTKSARDRSHKCSTHCWLPTKVMYPANSTKHFYWLTHSTSILLMKNVQIYKCSEDSTYTQHNQQTASSETPTKYCQTRRPG